MWSMYHGVVATNVWRARILNNIDPACISCDEVQPKTLIHKFHHYPKTTHAWSYAKTSLYKFVNLPLSHIGMWLDLTWQQCLVGSPLLRQLKPGMKVWSLLRGSVMWISWLARNANCFHADQWPLEKVECMIREALHDHARAAWKHFQTCCKLYPTSTSKFLMRFDDTWTASNLVCMWNGLSIAWHHSTPRMGLFS
jgi:hypothetical protein